MSEALHDSTHMLQDQPTAYEGEPLIESMIEAASIYANAAYALYKLGRSKEAAEIGERFLDTVALLVRYLPHLEYVEGAAEAAAAKPTPSWLLAEEPGYLEALLDYIASPTCYIDPADVVDDVAERLGVAEDARTVLLGAAARSCGAAKHVLALMLLTPPSRGVGIGGP